MNTRLWGCLIGFGLLFLVTGCATTPQRAEIPVGQWSGRGAFFLDSWTPSAGAIKPESERQQYGRYPTQLKIEPVPDSAPARVRIEIVSQHGRIEKMEGDRTHLVVELELRTALPDSAFAAYRLAAFGLSFDEQPPKMEDGPKGPTHATCMLVDGDLVLGIEYLGGFVDTLRFHGDVVFKDGTYYSEKGDGFIHWSEVLHR
jgi:hypothetical protein